MLDLQITTKDMLVVFDLGLLLDILAYTSFVDDILA